MGDLNEFSLSTRLFLRSYAWHRIEAVPWNPLSESRVVLVSSAGFVLPGQKPFDVSMRGGDPSFREIPAHVDASTLVESHRSRSFDHRGIRSDPNLAFPVDRLQELAQSGRIPSP